VLSLLYGLNLLNINWREAFKTFPGVKRRQEILYTDKNLVIIDDFAHHPTEVRVTLEELKKAIKPQKTIVIFEPRTNSSKRKVFQEDYVKSLSLADEIYLKIPPNLEKIPEEERLDIDFLLKALKNLGKRAYFLENNLKFDKILKRKTLFIFMSSAYFEKLEKIKEYILKTEHKITK
jgi:UDP-N-acetylmuramate: L-alanyl-gamma-D-glutamyl-meso-diaminopimelate ligase